MRRLNFVVKSVGTGLRHHDSSRCGYLVMRTKYGKYLLIIAVIPEILERQSIGRKLGIISHDYFIDGWQFVGKKLTLAVTLQTKTDRNMTTKSWRLA